MKKSLLIIIFGSFIVLSLCGCNNRLKDDEYIDVSSLNIVNSDSLFMFNDKLYRRSSGVIDYAGCEAYIGYIDTLIDNNLVPKKNGETNNKDMLNAGVCSANQKNSVINYNGEYVLFEIVRR